MGVSNVPMVAPLPGRSVRFLRKPKRFFAKNWKEIVDYELKIWELFLKSPRFLTPGTFLGNRLKIDIYTDACARPPYEMASINWASRIGIGGILAINDIVV